MGQTAQAEQLELIAFGHRQQVGLLAGRIVLGKPVTQVRGKIFNLFGLPLQAEVSIIWKWHR